MSCCFSHYFVTDFVTYWKKYEECQSEIRSTMFKIIKCTKDEKQSKSKAFVFLQAFQILAVANQRHFVYCLRNKTGFCSLSKMTFR